MGEEGEGGGERDKKRGGELEKERAESVQAYGEKQETDEKNPEFDSKTGRHDKYKVPTVYPGRATCGNSVQAQQLPTH